MAAQRPGSADPSDRDTCRPAVHCDGDGRQVVTRDPESLTQHLIREAHERGGFDDLPGRGRPSRLHHDVHAGEVALTSRMLHDGAVAHLDGHTNGAAS